MNYKPKYQHENMTDSLGDIAERHEDSASFNNTLDWPDFTSNPLRGVCARLKDAG